MCRAPELLQEGGRVFAALEPLDELLLLREGDALLLEALLRQVTRERLPARQLAGLAARRQRRRLVLPPQPAGQPALIVAVGSGRVQASATPAALPAAPLVRLGVAHAAAALRRGTRAARRARGGGSQLQQLPGRRRRRRTLAVV